MEFWLTSEKQPVPRRKRKDVSSALDQHEEYLALRGAILGGRMRPQQAAILKVGPDDIKKIGFKWPWRAIVDNLRRLIKSMNLESDFEVKKYETDTPGVWAVVVTYTPPMTSVQPHAETPAAPRKPLGRPRKTA